MKLMTMTLLAAFIPALAFADGSRSLGESLYGLTVKTGSTAGLEVVNVDAGGSAERAGIVAGDVIIKIDDIPMTTPDDLAKLWARNAASFEQEATLQIVRDQQPKELHVKREPKAPMQ